MYLLPWVETLILPTVDEMTPEECYLGALLGCLEAIRSGTTALMDFMFGIPNIEVHRAVMRAMRDSGIRGFFGRATRDLNPDSGWRDPWYLPLDEVFEQMRTLAREFPSGLPVPSVLPAPGTMRTMTVGGLHPRQGVRAQRGLPDHDPHGRAHRGAGDLDRPLGHRRLPEGRGDRVPRAPGRRRALRQARSRRPRGDRAHGHAGVLQPGQQHVPRQRLRARARHVRAGHRRQPRERRRRLRRTPRTCSRCSSSACSSPRPWRRIRACSTPATCCASQPRAAPRRSGSAATSARSTSAAWQTCSCSTRYRLKTVPMHDPISTLVYAG